MFLRFTFLTYTLSVIPKLKLQIAILLLSSKLFSNLFDFKFINEQMATLFY